MIKTKFQEWEISLDRMHIIHNSGFSLDRKFNIDTNQMEWVYEENGQNKLAKEGLRFYYHKEGVLLIQAYIDKNALSLIEVMNLINQETIDNRNKPGSYFDDQKDNVLSVLNEVQPRMITCEELSSMLEDKSYCEPWISSFLRTALYKSRKRGRLG